MSCVCFPETSQGREQLWQAVHIWENWLDAHGQAVHDELGPDGIYGLFLPQPWIRAARLRYFVVGISHFVISIYSRNTSDSTVSVLLMKYVGVSVTSGGSFDDAGEALPHL